VAANPRLCPKRPGAWTRGSRVRDIARHIGRFRPDVLLAASPELTVGMGRGRRFLNQADHRAVGLAVLDAARDAGNRWIFPESTRISSRGPVPPTSTSWSPSNRPTESMSPTPFLPGSTRSGHQAYLDGLGRDFDPDQFLRAVTAGAGRALGVQHAIALGRIELQGV
jgi:LmbE family N-acetylglucosaminyl deacetylase